MNGWRKDEKTKHRFETANIRRRGLRYFGTVCVCVCGYHEKLAKILSSYQKC